ncbi:transcription termination/antitermination protein NusG [Mameliella alba]|uniref:Transcription termination/antitermination protein NusG n=1 Tax=Mameliella alba TaxID=561184 RepID=A0A0B3RTS2_9RHOB|nr:transcription termination/antitermination NusG family protein [Mameliella alba]KHQ50178.1 Transcriptional antitermination protein [Mameliella alba]
MLESTSSNAAQGWFVAQLKPGGLTRARDNLRRQGFEVFCPERVVRGGPGTRPGRRPLFPGYLFVRFTPSGSGWRAINGTRGVTRLLLSDPRRPVPLPDPLIQGLQERCDATDLLQGPENDLTPGDRVRILSGPFADLVTRIECLSDSERIGVLVEIMGRSARVELAPVDIEKIH